tara:strand:+ start:270451 stop:270759 length:309 start_codon:yes stop_codon:yes gene_type:complete
MSDESKPKGNVFSLDEARNRVNTADGKYVKFPLINDDAVDWIMATDEGMVLVMPPDYDANDPDRMPAFAIDTDSARSFALALIEAAVVADTIVEYGEDPDSD